ncbi:hypothetical protein C8Q73DRAFT_780874 [Cubamyces lactineus]|nr:hypothetical protein C8Q73DRAFT_780874 [Cubamyces lactineus]
MTPSVLATTCEDDDAERIANLPRTEEPHGSHPPTSGSDSESELYANDHEGGTVAGVDSGLRPALESSVLHVSEVGLLGDSQPNDTVLPGPPPRPRTPVTKLLDSVAASVGNTPMRTGTASTVDLSRNRKETHSFLNEDVMYMTHRVPTNVWLKAVLGVDAGIPAQVKKDATDQAWHAKKEIADSLLGIQRAPTEPDMYDPLIKLLQCIRSEAKTRFTFKQGGAIDMFISRNDKKAPKKPESPQGRSDSARFPDIAWAGKPGDVLWVTLLLTLEAKLSSTAKKALRGKIKYSAPDESPSSAMLSTGTAPPDEVPARSSTKRRADTSDNDEGPSKKPKVSSATSPPKISELQGGELEAGLQALNGALLIVYHSKGTRLSSLAITLCGTAVTFWYIDPCGIVISDGGLCLVKDFADFAAAVVALECLDASGWGVIQRLILPEGMSTGDLLFAGTLRGCSFDIPGDSAADRMQHRITFAECMHLSYALVGRRTLVYDAQANPPFKSQKPGECIVAKFSYQVTTRVAEHELIARAHEKNVPYIPTVYGHCDLFDIESLQDSIRARIVKHCGAFYNYENRVARIIVIKMYTPLLQRLREEPLDLVRMVDHISECLHHLRHDALILHRDVSVSNIMCDETDGRVKFILTDFDLAVLVDVNGSPRGPTAKHRTGTLPFMAQRLLQDLASYPDCPQVPHELHHDYESLYWVALWCTMKADYDKQDAEFQKRIDQFLAQWQFAKGQAKSRASQTPNTSRDSNDQPETMSTTTISKLNLLTIAQMKLILLHDGKIGKEYPPTTERFKHAGISELLRRFRGLLHDAYGRDSFVATEDLTGSADGPREAGAAKADEGTKAGANKSDDDDFWTVPEGENVKKASMGTPMRDIITREAIKEVILEAKKAKKAAEKAKKAAEKAKKAAEKAKKAAEKVDKTAEEVNQPAE